MAENIVPRTIESDMRESYLDYAMSVIVGRAIPDARDGLKPVHRRILYSMWQTGLRSNTRYKKCATVVGDVLGHYHPHGDIAVYDALVRLAQTFSLRYPLVNGQGNFGCFTKDTKVKLIDGRELSFEELIIDERNGKKNYTYTVDEQGKIKIAQVKNPRLTTKNAKIMKVILDNEREIRCTLNHKFMLKTGEYVEAQNLKANDSLMPAYSRLSTKEEDPQMEGYERILQVKTGDWEYTHKLSDEWNLEHGIYANSAGRVRHHKDFNKRNNNPENIQRMNWSAHRKLHYELAAQRHIKDEEYVRKLKEGRDEFWNKEENRMRMSKHISKRNKENWKNETYREHMRNKLRESSTRYFQEHSKRRKEVGEQSTRILTRLWMDPEYQKSMRAKIIKGNRNHSTNKTGKQKFISICKKITEKQKTICEQNYEDIRNIVYPYKRATTWKTGIKKYFNNDQNLVYAEINKNHKVLRIEFLDQYEDVYDLTIDETHNFALAAGVFVHNSQDGDSAAAYRYTECKLKHIAEELLTDIEKETVLYTDNFDGTLKEPGVLPAKIPNLLINGSSGIAVGMATNMPPHNLREILDATIAHIDGSGEEDVIKHVIGPDFPTGGIIVGRGGILQAYKTGRGILRLRAKATKDDKAHKIVISEIPYQLTKTAVIESIVEAVKNKKIEGISGVHDRSDKDGMEILIDVKKGHDLDIVLNQLYAHTQLQSTFGIINLSLVGKQPKVLGIYPLITEFVKFRQEIVRKRCEFDLKEAAARAHILEGLRIALANIDPIVAFLRKSKNVEEARVGLMKDYSLSELQANAILEMRISKIVALEREKIENEFQELMKTIHWLKEVLANELKILEIIKKELSEIREKYGDNRRTEIIDGDGDVDIEELIPNDDVVVVISSRGYVKRVGLDEYRSQHRGGKGVIGTETKEEDFVQDVIVTRNHNYLLLFTDKGRVCWLKTYKIPESSRYSTGKTLVSLLNLQDEKVTSWISVDKFADNEFLFMVTKKGTVKRTALDNFSNVRKVGIIAITLKEDDRLVEVIKTDGKQQVLIATKKGQAIRFVEDEAREIGRTGQGVIGIRFSEDNDEVVGITECKKPTILTITEHGFGKRTHIDEYRLQGRGGSGVISIKVEGRNGNVVGVHAVEDTDEVIVMSSKGQAIRTYIRDISVIGRNTQGVRIIRLDEGETVASFTRVPPQQQNPELPPPLIEEKIDAPKEATETKPVTDKAETDKSSEAKPEDNE